MPLRLLPVILLHDYNLSGLIKKFGEKILADPRLEEYLAAAYNGKPDWVHNSLRATISKGLPDWVNTLSATRKDSLGGNGPRGFLRRKPDTVANEKKSRKSTKSDSDSEKVHYKNNKTDSIDVVEFVTLEKPTDRELEDLLFS